MKAVGRQTTWTEQEDDLLRELVAKHGTKKWALIASKIPEKASKQCRRRWQNYLNAQVKKGGWSAEEDAILMEGHRKYGNRWTEIAKMVQGRTDNAVKNRFCALCKKRSRQGTGGGRGGRGMGGGSLLGSPGGSSMLTGMSTDGDSPASRRTHLKPGLSIEIPHDGGPLGPPSVGNGVAVRVPKEGLSPSEMLLLQELGATSFPTPTPNGTGLTMFGPVPGMPGDTPSGLTPSRFTSLGGLASSGTRRSARRAAQVQSLAATTPNFESMVDMNEVMGWIMMGTPTPLPVPGGFTPGGAFGGGAGRSGKTTPLMPQSPARTPTPSAGGGDQLLYLPDSARDRGRTLYHKLLKQKVQDGKHTSRPNTPSGTYNMSPLGLSAMRPGSPAGVRRSPRGAPTPSFHSPSQRFPNPKTPGELPSLDVLPSPSFSQQELNVLLQMTDWGGVLGGGGEGAGGTPGKANGLASLFSPTGGANPLSPRRSPRLPRTLSGAGAGMEKMWQ